MRQAQDLIGHVLTGVFYDRHAACMQGVDVGQSGVDALHAAFVSMVKYAWCEVTIKRQP